MTRLLISTLTLAVAAQPAAAQTDPDGPVLAPIVRTERAGAGVIQVVYDLRGATGTLFTVSLEASNDGGQTFAIRPRATTGDVGPGVSPGTGKTVSWDSTKDIEDLQIDRFVFRVLATASGAPTGAVQPAAPRPVATPSAPPPTASGGSAGGGRRGGGLSRAAILALPGGGAAAAGVAIAVANGKGSQPPDNSPVRDLPTRTFDPTTSNTRRSSQIQTAVVLALIPPRTSEP